MPGARSLRSNQSPLTLRLPQARPKFIAFGGGLDTETPPLSVKPGTLREALNYEVGVEGGYVDTRGYERFDGRAAPCAASYWLLPCLLTGSIAVGATVEGGTSGATGVVLAVVDAATLVLTAVTGTWVAAESVEVSSVAQGVTTAAASERAAATLQLDAVYLGLAADHYRALITAVPGEGAIRGGWHFNGVNYAVRNATGGASAKLYKSTASGWTEVALGRELAFTSGGTYEIAVGDTITGATSGATAVVTGVAVRTGSFAGGDAVGLLTFATQTGTFQAESLDVGANPNVATIAGDSAAITLPAGGRYHTVRALFADTSGERVYGVNGVGPAFSFDGTTFIPIRTSGTDTPSYIAEFSQHLVLMFPKGLVRGSGTTKPYTFDVVAGAWEKRLAGEGTGIMVEPGSESNGALMLATRARIYMLYGNDAADFNLVPFRDAVGAYPHTVAQIGNTLFLDDVGVTTWRAAQEYGNFAHSSITQHIRSWLNPLRQFAVAACSVRERNQYRLFFSTGDILVLTFRGNKMIGAMPLWYPDAPQVVWCGEDSAGDEVAYFGTADGYVMQMHRGTSFDGEAIQAQAILHPVRVAGAEIQAEFHNFIIESQGTGYATWDVGYSLDYGSPDRIQPDRDLTTVSTFQPAVTWDTPGIVWDTPSLTWDGTGAQPSSTVRLRGSAENILLALRKSSAISAPVHHSGGHIRHTVRRLRT